MVCQLNRQRRYRGRNFCALSKNVGVAHNDVLLNGTVIASVVTGTDGKNILG